VLSRSGLARRIRIRVRRYVAAMDIVARTDMLLTLPLRYAQVINLGYGHDLLPLPIKMAPMEFFGTPQRLAILQDGGCGTNWPGPSNLIRQASALHHLTPCGKGGFKRSSQHRFC